MPFHLNYNKITATQKLEIQMENLRKALEKFILQKKLLNWKWDITCNLGRF